MRDTIKIEWIGSRSKQKQTYDIMPSMTISQFKKMIFDNNHGTEFCPPTYEMEQDWTECHNVMLVKSGKILDKDKQTFADYGLTNDRNVPFELSFKLCVDGGARRKIDETITDFGVKPNDPDCVVAILSAPDIDYNQFIRSLPDPDFELLFKQVMRQASVPRVTEWMVQNDFQLKAIADR